LRNEELFGTTDLHGYTKIMHFENISIQSLGRIPLYLTYFTKTGIFVSDRNSISPGQPGGFRLVKLSKA